MNFSENPSSTTKLTHTHTYITHAFCLPLHNNLPQIKNRINEISKQYKQQQQQKTARAIENQCYVLAAAQYGIHNEKRNSFGHSLVS